MGIFSTKERLALQWRMWEHYQDAFVTSISGEPLPQIPNSIDFRVNFLSGDINYRELKKAGKLPRLFQVGEQIKENRNKTCVQSPVLDPVYNFLLDVNQLIEKTASEMYDQRNTDKSDIGREEEVEGKCNSLKKMIEFFETRGRLPPATEENESLRVNSEERYQYLLSFLGDKERGLFSQKKLEEFIDMLPSQPYDQIYWPDRETQKA